MRRESRGARDIIKSLHSPTIFLRQRNATARPEMTQRSISPSIKQTAPCLVPARKGTITRPISSGSDGRESFLIAAWLAIFIAQSAPPRRPAHTARTSVTCKADVGKADSCQRAFKVTPILLLTVPQYPRDNVSIQLTHHAGRPFE